MFLRKRRESGPRVGVARRHVLLLAAELLESLGRSTYLGVQLAGLRPECGQWLGQLDDLREVTLHLQDAGQGLPHLVELGAGAVGQALGLLEPRQNLLVILVEGPGALAQLRQLRQERIECAQALLELADLLLGPRHRLGKLLGLLHRTFRPGHQRLVRSALLLHLLENGPKLGWELLELRVPAEQLHRRSLLSSTSRASRKGPRRVTGSPIRPAARSGRMEPQIFGLECR